MKAPLAYVLGPLLMLVACGGESPQRIVPLENKPVAAPAPSVAPRAPLPSNFITIELQEVAADGRPCTLVVDTPRTCGTMSGSGIACSGDMQISIWSPPYDRTLQFAIEQAGEDPEWIRKELRSDGYIAMYFGAHYRPQLETDSIEKISGYYFEIQHRVKGIGRLCEGLARTGSELAQAVAICDSLRLKGS